MEWPPPLHKLVQCYEEWEELEYSEFAAKHSTLVAHLRHKLNVREHHTDSPRSVLRTAMLQFYNYAVGNRRPQA